MRDVLKYVFLSVVAVTAVVFFILKLKNVNVFSGLFEPVEVISKVASETKELQTTDGRTNILILGIDSRNSGDASGTALTDTILVVSIDGNGSNPVLISIPRDVWVKYNNGGFKINSYYTRRLWDYEKNFDKAEASRKALIDTSKAVEGIVGIPIHYYVVVGFEAFKEAVEAVDGIEVDVDQAFDDYQYPIEGKENAIPESARYMHVHFDAGKQVMDSEKALQYSRSRHSTNPAESGDFARARRQQKVVEALKNKIMSKETLLNPDTLSELYNAYKDNVITNIGLGEALVFLDTYKNIDIGEAKKIVLSNETFDENVPGSGMLTAPSEQDREELYSGAYVLVPASGSYEMIYSLVRSTLFE